MAAGAAKARCFLMVEVLGQSQNTRLSIKHLYYALVEHSASLGLLVDWVWRDFFARRGKLRTSAVFTH